MISCENVSFLKCPVCGFSLEKSDRVYRCKSGHSFDISKKGYVNLAMSQSSSKKRHGDDKVMINARRDFLDKGFYAPLADALISAVRESVTPGGCIIDAGCGEGYYTAKIHSALPDFPVCGIDISKDALIAAAHRDRTLTLAAASTAKMPVIDSCASAVISVFAPIFPAEALRVLKPEGKLIRAVPLEDHLYELKQAIYDKAYKNPYESGELEGFNIISPRELLYDISLESQTDINALFMMTPYYYKTSRSDQEKLSSLSNLTTRAAFAVLIYEPKK